MRGIITSRFIHTLAERERGRVRAARWWFTHMLCNGGVTVVLFVPEYDDGHLDFRLFSHSLARPVARSHSHAKSESLVNQRCRRRSRARPIYKDGIERSGTKSEFVASVLCSRVTTAGWNLSHISHAALKIMMPPQQQEQDGPLPRPPPLRPSRFILS